MGSPLGAAKYNSLLQGAASLDRLGTTGLESDSARNSIHPNVKQKPEIANKNIGKRTCQCGQPD